MAKPVEVVIVDDHQMFADGLAGLISGIGDHYRCTSIASPLTALRMFEEGRRFDLVISDLIMDSINGIAFVKALRARGARMPVLIISGISTAPPVEEALRLGAQGFIPKTASSAMLDEALDTVLAGDIFLPPKLWDIYEHNSRSPAAMRQGADETSVKLSQRQLEVLQLVSEGYSNRRVAGVLQVSENTIKTHVKRIFQILDVNTRAACVRRAQSLGLID
ncbi:response regulator [Hoeflea prorocentri]|uniref:Response regulator transcription factor n=1 Tax=Hoeflea prorocentri TaxID=1922333 RepID=A0A9X3UGV7_9HYPH|nr:response regulator transcription factor [Hoeflea prorocentri]MCY6381138.1 response regulator transcription factor [Hoeflea prorocentri]MDA5398938.1 response regulator transcription factor [Hoeflea prorocentri]